MRKISNILFLAMYILVTAGVTVAIHFCGGKVISVQMLPIIPNESPCGCNEFTTPDDCCKTEMKSFQVNDEQIAVQVDQPTSPQSDVNLWAETSFDELYSSNSIHTILPASSPPDSTPSYILHCTLLI